MDNAELRLENGMRLTLQVNFRNLKRLKQMTGVDLLQSGHGERLTEVDVLPAALWAFSDAETQGFAVDDVAEAMDVKRTVEYINVLQGLIAPDPTGPSDQGEEAVAAASP